MSVIDADVEESSNRQHITNDQPRVWEESK